MKAYHNIETRPFPGHNFRIGYSGKNVFHINIRHGGYLCIDHKNKTQFSAKNLDEVSKKLEELKK